MRRKLIEALTYPRLFILENMDLEDCPRDGRFDATCKKCRECALGQECHWMSCLNNFDDLASKPIHTIHASLLYSINLIESRAGELEHDVESCTCESCTWTRDAQELSLEFSNKFAWTFSTDHTTGA